MRYTPLITQEYAQVRTFAYLQIPALVISCMEDGKPKRRVTVLLTDDELVRLERYCLDHGFKKSTLFAKLLRDRMEQEGYAVPGELPLTFDRQRRGGPRS